MSTDWQTKVDTLVQRAEYILKNGLWTDCTFEVGIEDKKTIFKGHKLILSMASPVFDRMFLHDGMLETENKHVEIVDIQPEAFSLLLKYIYTERLEINSFDQACELCYIANKYLMPTLVQKCSSYIWKDLNISNVCRCYEFAKLFSQTSLMDTCKEIICMNTSELIQNESFLDIDKDVLLMILDQDVLNIESELALFKAVVEWMKARVERNDISCEMKDSLFNLIISKIRFLTMTPSEFAECLDTSDLIDRDKRLSIFLIISSRSKDYPVPEGISVSRKARNEERIISWNLDSVEHFDLSEPSVEPCFSLTCNMDIKLLGVQVHGLVFCPEECGTFSDPMEFVVQRNEEAMTAFIDNTEGHLHKHAFTKSADGVYKETIRIYFKTGVLIEANKKYSLGVEILRPGLFVAGVLKTCTIQKELVKFQLTNTNPDGVSFISGLIYSF